MSDNQLMPAAEGSTALPQDVQNALVRLNFDIKAGDIFIDYHRAYWQVEALYLDKGELYVRLKEIHTNWPSTKTEKAADLRDKKGIYSYARLPGTIEEATQLALQALQDPSVIDLDTREANVDEKSLVAGNISADQMRALERQFAIAQSHALALQRLIERRLRGLQAVADKMGRRLKYLRRVLNVFEAYLGIYEQTVILQEGEPARQDTPITIRQLVLHMDEEVGDVTIYTDRSGMEFVGIDFANVEKFDEWLLLDNNYELITPEPKCIVALRPSRQHRHYHSDSFKSQDERNKILYFLMRNGESLYRICTSEIEVESLLFPPAEEWDAIMEAVDTAEESEDEARMLEAKHEELNWVQRLAFVQGILERTEVMLPMTHPVNLFDPDTYGSMVSIVRDGEATLPDGHLPYKEWRRQINAQIQRGSRIYLAPIPLDKDGWRDRFSDNFWRTTPSRPEPGIYKVEEVQEKQVKLVEGYVDPETGTNLRIERSYRILYSPDDGVWDDWEGFRPRKRRVSFWLKSYDDFFLNYDLASVDDIAFYISCRLERRHFLQMLPVLRRLYEARIQERKDEAHFVRLVAADLNCDESLVWKAVEWWKMKVIWKRPIREDDAKAWRMIRQRLNRELDC